MILNTEQKQGGNKLCLLSPLEQKGPVGIITMNRPDALNALNEQVLRDLDAVLDQVEEREDILVAIVTGAGPLLRSRRGHRPDVHPHFRGGQEIRRFTAMGSF